VAFHDSDQIFAEASYEELHTPSFTLNSFLVGSNSFSQQLNEPDKIVMIGSGTIEVTADLAIMNIQLTFSDKLEMKKAYDQHKEVETQLVQFFRNSHIPDSVIT
jgi:uncharacterized protein YggE